MFISLVLLISLNKFKIKSFIPFLIVGIFLWDFTHQSGIHATIAGVLLALTIPHNVKSSKNSMLLKLGTDCHHMWLWNNANLCFC